MNYNFEYLDIVLLALFAGFIILRLREILGRRTGHERKQYQNFEQKDFKENTDLNRPLSKLNDFNDEAKKNFLKGADVAYEAIITAFAKGDKKKLKPLLGNKIYENFSSAIDERNGSAAPAEFFFQWYKEHRQAVHD